MEQSELGNKGFHLTEDIEKAFDLVNHFFIFRVLEKFEFGKYFIKRIKSLLANQETCEIMEEKHPSTFS